MSICYKKRMILHLIACIFICLVLPVFRASAAETTREIPVKVELDGASEEEAGKITFQFRITPDDEENPMPEKDTISINGKGNGSFSIPYSSDRPGIYSYTVEEVKGDRTDVEYSTLKYHVKLQVTNDGMPAVVSIRETSDDGVKPDAAEFKNLLSKQPDPPKDGEDKKQDPQKNDKNKNPNPPKQGSDSTSAVKTGDISGLYFWIALCLGSVMVMSAAVYLKKRKDFERR